MIVEINPIWMFYSISEFFRKEIEKPIGIIID